VQLEHPEPCDQKVSPSVYTVEVQVGGKTIVIGSAVAARTWAPRFSHLATVEEFSLYLDRSRMTTNVLVSCAHILKAAVTNSIADAMVHVTQKGKSWVAQSVYLDEQHDLWFLKVPNLNAHPVEIRVFETLQVGEDAFAIGSPQGLSGSFTSGVISALREDPRLGSVVQTTAPISHGSSGGALFDSAGNLIGIMDFFYADGENLNFAISADAVTAYESYQDGLLRDAGSLADVKDPAAMQRCGHAMDAASDHFRESLAWLCHGYYRLETDDLSGAEKAALQAKAVYAENIYVPYLLGLTYAAKGEYQEALEQLMLAARQIPGQKSEIQAEIDKIKNKGVGKPTR